MNGAPVFTEDSAYWHELADKVDRPARVRRRPVATDEAAESGLP